MVFCFEGVVPFVVVKLEGGNPMAYETKVILMSLANQVAMAKTTKQAFEMIRSAAEVEGVSIPDYEVVRAKFMDEEELEK